MAKPIGSRVNSSLNGRKSRSGLAIAWKAGNGAEAMTGMIPAQEKLLDCLDSSSNRRSFAFGMNCLAAAAAVVPVPGGEEDAGIVEVAQFREAGGELFVGDDGHPGVIVGDREVHLRFSGGPHPPMMMSNFPVRSAGMIPVLQRTG